MSTSTFTVSANIVDVPNRRIFPGTVTVSEGRITQIAEDAGPYETYLIPGFIDAHVHIESSLLVPSEFARLAVRHGTVATVSDPHEIGNVLGIEGVEYMLDNGRTTPFKFYFGAPSCVPATAFETAGAEIGLAETEALLARDEVKYLSEMMNFPGVLAGDELVLAKIDAAHRLGKRIDGHAPGLDGDLARRYFAAGITTDHECCTLAEAAQRLSLGVSILVREGSAACNFEALWPLVSRFPDQTMFCSDDKHPDALQRGHINLLVRDAVARGVPPLAALRAACVNPVHHYGLDVGLLQTGDPADFVEVGDLSEFTVRRVWIDGALVAENGKTLLARTPVAVINQFHAEPKTADEFAVEAQGTQIKVIEAIDGQIITRAGTAPARTENGLVHADPASDVLKIAVVNRYLDVPPAVGFVRNFGLTRGAIASSVAHDSHNIVAVGATDDALCRAVNLVIAHKGGLVVIDGDTEHILPLPVAGLMSDADGFEVAACYAALDDAAKSLGCPLSAPFMTLSFLALLVIPTLKMSDLGLFDTRPFALVDLFTE